MMKPDRFFRWYPAAIAAALLACLTPHAAAFDTAGWAWERSVTADVTQAGYVRLDLPLDVLGACEPSLQDLRILDAAGSLVPFVTDWSDHQQPAQREWKAVTLLNPVFQPEQYSRVTLDFGKATRKNRVKIVTSGENYRRRVLVEGSDNGTDWDIVLEHGWIFDVPLPNQHYKADEVNFPLNDFRYLRVTVYNMPDDPRRIAIQSVQAAYWTQPPPATLPSVAVKAKAKQFDKKKKQTIYELDLGFKHVPVASLRLKIADTFYYRAFELSGRNEKTITTRRKTETNWDKKERDAPWHQITRGVLYRMNHQNKVSEHNAIEGLNAPYRFLRLRLFEQDNPPLGITRFEVKRHKNSLIFHYQPGAPYTLIGGNPKATHPSFDLARAVQGLASRELPAASVGAAQALQPVPKTGSWATRYSVLLWGALILAVAVVSLLIIRNLSKLNRA